MFDQQPAGDYDEDSESVYERDRWRGCSRGISIRQYFIFDPFQLICSSDRVAQDLQTALEQDTEIEVVIREWVDIPIDSGSSYSALIILLNSRVQSLRLPEEAECYGAILSLLLLSTSCSREKHH